jgi:uncharacterized protein YjbI with pentapeptide repeats
METRKVGNKIAEARKKLNISQAQLAESLFISAQAVGKWERGESMPDIITFSRLAEILGVDFNYFSERFHSVASEIALVELSEKQTAELQSDKQNKKVSWDMSHGNWVDADFSGLKNLHDKFSHSNMQRCLFIGSKMSGLLLKSNNVDGCDFSGSDFSNSHIYNSYLANNQFKDSSLQETEFSGSYIYGCDFSGADFTAVKIKSGGFEKNTNTNAVWKHTSFIDTQIVDTVFEGTVENCSFENCKFTRVTFQNVTLTDTFFKCKSLKRIKFIDCKADRLTYAFLKNGKADLTGVTLITK